MSTAGSEPFIRDVSKLDAGLLVRWWNEHDQKHRYYSRRDGRLVLKHGYRWRLWTVYRDVIGRDTGLRFNTMFKNSDERLRQLERASLAAPDDAAALVAYARELDRVGRPGMAQAEILDRFVKYAVWRSGEVMRPRNPMSWENDGPLGCRRVVEIVNECLGRGIAESVMRERPSPVVYDIAVEAFQQVRPCVDERHHEPCAYDGCQACLEECIPPEEGGGAPAYDRKVAAVFAAPLVDDQLLIGIKATPERLRNGWPGGSADPLYVVFRERTQAIGSGESRRLGVTPNLFMERLVDTDEVRVYDNGGRTADRFTILMRGETDEDPWDIAIAASANQAPNGVWMTIEAAFDPDEPGEVGRELDPWQELLHRDVLDRLWDERGAEILRVPCEVAALWVDLVRVGHFQ